MVALGAVAGLTMPACVGLVNVASALLRRDFWQEGRSATRLGLADLDIAQLKALVRGELEGRGDVSAG
jgi:hypothetical protein